MTEKDPISGCSLTKALSPGNMQVICRMIFRTGRNAGFRYGRLCRNIGSVRQVVQVTQRGVCVLRTLLHGKTKTPVMEIYLKNPTQHSTATDAALQVLYDRNVGGGIAPSRYDLAAETAAGVL